MSEHTPYQKKAIRRFYENRGQMDEQHLSELVTDLYLASGKQQERLWQRAEEIMRRLQVSDRRIQHVVQSADPAVLAAVVQEIQQGLIGPSADSAK